MIFVGLIEDYLFTTSTAIQIFTEIAICVTSRRLNQGFCLISIARKLPAILFK
jgi:hypothetical protein